MADFAPNYTARLRVKYTQGGKSHSQTWRAPSTEDDPAGLVAKVGDYYGDIDGILFDDFEITGADWALADSDVFLPVTPPTSPTGAVAFSGFKPTDAACYVGFVGRTLLGGKARLFQYGTNYGANIRTGAFDDWRVTSAEAAAISAAVVRLNETSPSLVGNDDAVAVWYEYANIKYNDRWVRRQRRG